MSDPKQPSVPPNSNPEFNPQGAEAALDQASADIAHAAAHAAALQAELNDMKDRYLRAVAETENLRKRADRERTEASQFGIQRFAKDLLDVADNFRRALEAVPVEARKNLSPQISNLLTGIEATENQMLAVFERHQLKRLDPKGERFDPNLHQAIAEAPNPETPEGHISDVAQHGFTLAGRLIRPAMVVVSRGPVSPDATRPTGGADLGGKLDTKA